MPADVIDYRLIGDDLQGVVITLDPGEGVIAEAGAMLYMDDGIQMATTLDPNNQGGGLFGKLLGAGKRILTGESFFITMFGNAGARTDCIPVDRIVHQQRAQFHSAQTLTDWPRHRRIQLCTPRTGSQPKASPRRSSVEEGRADGRRFRCTKGCTAGTHAIFRGECGFMPAVERRIA